MPDAISESKPIPKDAPAVVADAIAAQGPVPLLSAADEARVAKLEREVAQLRRALKDYYDIDGKGQVG